MFSWLTQWLFSNADDHASGSHLAGIDPDSNCNINPASGLPMIGDCGGVDIEGNPYGTDLHDDTFFSSDQDFTSSFSNDDFSSDSGFGGFGDD